MKLTFYYFVSIFFTTTTIHAQVGIYTSNPQGTFNIDAAKDNPAVGTPSAAQAANDLTVSTSGNLGIGLTSPTNKIHINGTDPIRATGIQAGNSNTDRPLVVDGNGVFKSINTLSVLGIPTPAIYRLETVQNNFLNGVGAGSNQTVPMVEVKNTINGLTYNSTSRVLTIPPGNYQMVFVYEATHDDTAAGSVTPPSTRCTISSYIVDFPTGAGTTTQRIHSTSAHNAGGLSNHGGTVTFTTQITGTRNWTIQLGRGQSGNCSGVGMTLAPLSTHLLVFRIGDV